MSESARFIKGTDVKNYLRRQFGKKPSEIMLRDISSMVERRINQWAKGTHLKKVYTWNSSEDELRLKFGGKRGLDMCWGCHKKKPDVERGRCAECGKRPQPPEVS